MGYTGVERSSYGEMDYNPNRVAKSNTDSQRVNGASSRTNRASLDNRLLQPQEQETLVSKTDWNETPRDHFFTRPQNNKGTVHYIQVHVKDNGPNEAKMTYHFNSQSDSELVDAARMMVDYALDAIGSDHGPLRGSYMIFEKQGKNADGELLMEHVMFDEVCHYMRSKGVKVNLVREKEIEKEVDAKK